MKVLLITRALRIRGKSESLMRPLLFLSLLWPTGVLAHAGEAHDRTELKPQLQIGTMFSMSAYSATAADANGLWRIPGLLMGGDALPNEQGTQVDDAQVWARYQWLPTTAVQASVGTHAGHAELSIENLYLDYQPANFAQLELSAGLMDASFSPNASSHHLIETSLLAEAFWGGSIHDLAVSAVWQVTSKLRWGLELREGDFFPATQGEGAQLVFAQTEQEWQQLKLKAGIWGMQAQAVQRSDERYQAGHSHGTNSFTPADVRFSGDSELVGIWLASSLPLSTALQAGLDYELVQAKADGDLSESNYQAAYQAKHLGYAFTPSLQAGAWNLSYRFEKLSLDNRLSGSGAAVLAQEANLLNSEQAQRQTLQLAWQTNKNLGWRLAYTQDETLPKTDERFSVGLVWQQSLYER